MGDGGDGGGAADTVEGLRAALEAKDEKMKKWKDKMKAIIDEERGELVRLREEKEGFVRRVEELEMEVARRKQEVHMDPEAIGGPSADAGQYAAQIEKLQQEKQAVVEDFERFKERTNVAMKLRGKELASKQSKHSTLEDDLKVAQLELDREREERRKREVEFRRLEEEAAQASITVSRQLQIAATESERLKRTLEAEKRSLIASQREALQDAKDAMEEKAAETVRMYEQELQQVWEKVDEAQATAVAKANNRLDHLVKENVTLQAEVEKKVEEIVRMKQEADQMRTLERVPSAGSASTSDKALKDLKSQVRRLTEENEHQTKRVWHLQRELIEAKDSSGELQKAHSSGDDGMTGEQQMSYLRGVLMNFFTASDEIKGTLVPLLATLVHLSPDDIKRLYVSNPAWMPS